MSTPSLPGVVLRRQITSGNQTVEEKVAPATYAEYIAMTSETTTEPSNTTPDETTGGGETTEPPVTTEKRKGNALGGVSDLGKIFLDLFLITDIGRSKRGKSYDCIHRRTDIVGHIA